MNEIRRAGLIALIIGFLLIGATASDYGNDTAAKGNEKIGVLVIAHGSDEDRWVQQIRESVENVSLPYPTKLGFLEFVPNETIGDAVEELDESGVDRIIAVPLFISSYSSHIQEIEYILGLRETPPGDEKLEMVETAANITLARAMDDHLLVAYILADRIAEQSQDPANETAVIVAHGSADEGDLRSQTRCQNWLAEETKMILRTWVDPAIKIKDIKNGFIHVNETVHKNLTARAVVENASIDGGVIVIPLMIANGEITDKQIPQLLQGLKYRYNGESLASHSDLSRWIETTVRCELGHETNGVLLVDHGSTGPERAEAVRKLASDVDLGVPIAVAFNEHPLENETISASIARLLDQGVNNLIVVTLFTGSTVDHDEVRENVYSALQDLNQTKILHKTPIHMGLHVTIAGPVDDSPLIAEMLLDRAREVSKDEENETLVICPWGSSTYFEHSELQAKSLAEKIERSQTSKV
jgi:sirohydrochlorin ferrochelatase